MHLGIYIKERKKMFIEIYVNSTEQLLIISVAIGMFPGMSNLENIFRMKGDFKTIL